MSKIAPVLLALACLVWGQGSAAAPATASAPLTIGEAHQLPFARGDVREVNAYLPDGYRQETNRYPVLYVIDGGLSPDFLHIAGTGAQWRGQARVGGSRSSDR